MEANMLLNRSISIIGLGYVGLSIATALSQKFKIVAFDISPVRIDELKNHYDRNEEIDKLQLSNDNLFFTCSWDDLKLANFHIISVPTPLDRNKHPDLSLLISASKTLGERLKKGDIVVYESTVYPGATEEECIPVLEQASSLKCGTDFTVGYSPERVNPADKKHIFETIVKIISATDENTLDIIESIYSSVITAGVFRVSSIRVAEAAKVIENIQRDVNIALMNDFAIMLHTLKMDMTEVIPAMKTKWNCLPFEPGFVGGHCIGINSYYLMHKAKEKGYYSEIISAGRRTNESMAKFITATTIKQLVLLGATIKGARIGVLGLTYKENCVDIHDTRVMDIINELESYSTITYINDPIADPITAKKDLKIELTPWEKLYNLDAIIICMAHEYYKKLSSNHFISILKSNGLIIDVKNIINPNEFKNSQVTIWRL